MKSQLSLEFLLYLSFAGLSLLLAGKVISAMSSSYESLASYLSIYQFVNAINSAIIEGNESVHVFIPEALCNSSISNGAIVYNGNKFQFAESIKIQGALSPCNTYAELFLFPNNTSVEIRRIK